MHPHNFILKADGKLAKYKHYLSLARQAGLNSTIYTLTIAIELIELMILIAEWQLTKEAE